MEKIPVVRVGIMNEPRLMFTFHGDYVMNGRHFNGTYDAECIAGRLTFEGETFEQIEFTPTNEATDSFELADVTIGVNFHWERKENQRFRGALRIIVENGKLTPVNILSVEEYLFSVISSEMSATASINLLKAHAVISRSWLMSQIQKGERIKQQAQEYVSTIVSDDELIRWQDREDHVNFDVCADDHCQRYQGITRANTPQVAEAIKATCGEVVMYDGELCDARFSKCCGGVFEQFESCWEPVHYSYLEPKRDGEDENNFPDLTIEENARQWILSSPEAFCNTHDKRILSQVLNNYDQETTDFYRWTVEYTQDEISKLIKERTGIDFGKIKALVPVERGTSARLIKMRIEGEKKTMTIGKELEIRHALSTSHLYSSAFVVETEGEKDGYPEKFILKGAGWGHGVGLCQIGAAVMGDKGYDYKKILLHYFIGASIEKLY